MSSFTRELKNPKTGKMQKAYCIDDYYGPHRYGYGFRRDGEDAAWQNMEMRELDFYRDEDLNE